MEESKYSQEIDENKTNVNKIRCQFCNSLILSKNTATYSNQQFSLPLMQQKKQTQPEEAPDQQFESEQFDHFWLVDDMFTFDNVGFSNTIGNHKFLVCADCEMGPIGYHDLESKKSFVALSRVKHGEAA